MAAPDRSRRRALGHASRLSLNFPIQTSDYAHSSTQSSAPGTPILRNSTPSSPNRFPIVPSETTDFLTVLAAQERRVLELKEELSKAESDLEKLQKQWAAHEATRNRREIRRSEPMRPLSMSSVRFEETSEDESVSVRLSLEKERRRLMRASTHPAQRKVFSGGRHTRALSLLSPTTSSSNNSLSQSSLSGIEPPMTARSVSSMSSPQLQPRSLAMKNLENNTSHKLKDNDQVSELARDALLRTGKRMAVDIKAGLWTFIEDLRQATVGDEGVNATEPRAVGGSGASRRQVSHDRSGRQGLARNASRESINSAKRAVDIKQARRASGNALNSTNSRGSSASGQPRRRPKSAFIEVDGSFWEEYGVQEKGRNTVRREESPPTADMEDDWDNWDSPNTKVSSSRGSSADYKNSPMTAATSRRTSNSSIDIPRSTKHMSLIMTDPIPWPSLSKISPLTLTRTASNLMAEWEKSLSPPPEPKENGYFFPTGKCQKGD
ncbi:MAG: hypothetical protein M1834_005081 [Cirrosporium novae-zelandiae]|nr:MAG: hypothetical protein M1834_005081 [Cirrosporium novae-zelandiae]